MIQLFHSQAFTREKMKARVCASLLTQPFQFQYGTAIDVHKCENSCARKHPSCNTVTRRLETTDVRIGRR